MTTNDRYTLANDGEGDVTTTLSILSRKSTTRRGLLLSLSPVMATVAMAYRRVARSGSNLEREAPTLPDQRSKQDAAHEP